MRVSKIIAALVVALLAIYLAAAPYITVHQIKSAAKAHDGVALSQHIDFDSVRLSLKEQLNAKFARVEQIKKFYLLQNQLTAEDEELTPTMKLKRKLVEKKYAEAIAAMYR